MMALGTNRSGALQLFPDRIVLGTHVLDQRGLRADVAVWKQANLWTTLGSLIHLQTPSGSLWIGGAIGFLRCAAIVSPRRRSMPASPATISWISFDPSSSSPIRWRVPKWLVPLSSTCCRARLRGADSGTRWPLNRDDGAGGCDRHPCWIDPLLQAGVGLVIVQTATVIVVIGGVVFTMRRSMRPPKARWQLRVDPMRVALFDLRTGSFVDGTVPRPPADKPDVSLFHSRGHIRISGVAARVAVQSSRGRRMGHDGSLVHTHRKVP